VTRRDEGSEPKAHAPQAQNPSPATEESAPTCVGHFCLE